MCWRLSGPVHDPTGSLIWRGTQSAGVDAVGCATQLVKNIEQPLTGEDVKQLGCRPDDKIDTAYIAEGTEPRSLTHDGKTYLTQAPKTTANHVTAWWDASQLYGYDERSGKRVKHDPKDPVKLLLMK